MYKYLIVLISYSAKLAKPSDCGSLLRPVYMAAVCVVLAMSLNACGVTQQISDDEIRSKYADVSPRQALKVTSERYSTAIGEKYDYFSPINWNNAGEALKEANRLAKEDPESLQILKQTYMVDKYIDSAAYIKNTALGKFRELFTLQEVLTANKAQSSYARQFKSVNGRLAQIIKDFEQYTMGIKNESATQKNIELKNVDLQKSMVALNINVVKFNHLSQAKKDLQQLSTLRAIELAPVTYHEAVNALGFANRTIEQDMYDDIAIQEAAVQFRFAVNHASHVLSAVIALSKMKINQYEEVILKNELNLHQIGQALKVDDLRDKPIPEQTQVLLDKVAGVFDHHSEKSGMIIDLSEKNMRLKAELKELRNAESESNNKLTAQINTLKDEIQALEKARHDLKQDMAKLQQKNIDLAIEVADLTSKLEVVKDKTKENAGINQDDLISGTNMNTSGKVRAGSQPASGKLIQSGNI